MCKLGDWLGQYDLVMETLQAICLSVSQGRTARNAEDGTSISESGRKPGQPIAEAGSH